MSICSHCPVRGVVLHLVICWTFFLLVRLLKLHSQHSAFPVFANGWEGGGEEKFSLFPAGWLGTGIASTCLVMCCAEDEFHLAHPGRCSPSPVLSRAILSLWCNCRWLGLFYSSDALMITLPMLRGGGDSWAFCLCSMFKNFTQGTVTWKFWSVSLTRLLCTSVRKHLSGSEAGAKGSSFLPPKLYFNRSFSFFAFTCFFSPLSLYFRLCSYYFWLNFQH